MSKDWEVKGKASGGIGDIVVTVLTCGLASLLPDTYVVENKETGERKEVTASNEKELGEKISRGEFDRS